MDILLPAMCVPPYDLGNAHYQRISSIAYMENRFSRGGNNAPEWVATIARNPHSGFLF
jgi:hypothetical protein